MKHSISQRPGNQPSRISSVKTRTISDIRNPYAFPSLLPPQHPHAFRLPLFSTPFTNGTVFKFQI